MSWWNITMKTTWNEENWEKVNATPTMVFNDKLAIHALPSFQTRAHAIIFTATLVSNTLPQICKWIFGLFINWKRTPQNVWKVKIPEKKVGKKCTTHAFEKPTGPLTQLTAIAFFWGRGRRFDSALLYDGGGIGNIVLNETTWQTTPHPGTPALSFWGVNSYAFLVLVYPIFAFPVI